MKSYLTTSHIGWLTLLIAGACSAAGTTGSGGYGGNGHGGAGGITMLTDLGTNPLTGVGLGTGTGGGDQNIALVPKCTSQCTDFPTAPFYDTGLDASVASKFPAASGSGGPCVLEPQDGSIFPANWLRPRVRFTGGSAGPYKLTFHADVEANDYVAYTNSATWALPKDVWTKLAQNVFDPNAITLTVETTSGASTKVQFFIAPVDAGGTIVFWHSIFGEKGYRTSALFGFSPGDEGVVPALYPDQVNKPIVDTNGQLIASVDPISSNIAGAIPVTAPAVPKGEASCVGCHSAVPGGGQVATTGFWPWNVALSDVSSAATAGNLPSYVSPAGRMMAQSPWQGVTTFSAGAWDATDSGKHRYVSSFAGRTIDPTQPWNFWPGGQPPGGHDELIWVDLSATAPADAGMPVLGANGVASATVGQFLVPLRGTVWDIIARTGDTRGAVTPNWSHDGTQIAYTSTDSSSDGRLGPGGADSSPATEIDIYTVPFNGGKGGTATAVANEKGVAEYYPSFSPDDKFIAYNRVEKIDQNPMYYRPDAELYIIPAPGGAKVRLAANDPPTCAGLAKSTLHNSWPKWAPHPKSANGDTYYFMTFSSARYTTVLIADTYTNTRVASELYLTAVKVDSKGTVTTYPAAYMWNQNNLVTSEADGGAAVTNAPGLNVTPAWEEFVIPPVPPVEIHVH